MRQNCEIPEAALRNWTPEVLAQNCVVEETYSNSFVRILSIKTCFKAEDGTTTEPLPLRVKTGTMKNFDLKKVSNDGKPMSMFTMGIRPVGPSGEAFRDFSDNVDAFVRDHIIRVHNPDTPKGGKYFKKNPTTMDIDAYRGLAEEKVKQNFWTDTNKTRDDGSLWDRIGNVSFWPNSTDTCMVDAAAQGYVPESESLKKGNTLVLTVEPQIILSQTTVKVRWTVVSGMVVEQASAGGFGFTPDFYASTYGNYVSSAPKPNPAIQAMPLPGGNNDTFGGVTFGYSD
jgi:hypothetical protein